MSIPIWELPGFTFFWRKNYRSFGFQHTGTT
jgi:hypothetical protein